MSYLEAWDVKAALIRVFGPAGCSWTQQDAQITQIEKVPKAIWKNNVKELLPFPENFNWQITAMVRGTLTIHQTGAEYGGVALSTQVGPTFGDVADFAMKTADSDALKRGAIFLGTQFGLSLYDDGSTVDIVKMSMAEDALWPQPDPDAKEIEVKNANGDTAVKEVNAEGQKLVDRALKMAEERDNARSEEPVNEDTPLALDTSLDTEPTNA
jgi:recombination DNA repair RAD52 pathway protein